MDGLIFLKKALLLGQKDFQCLGPPLASRKVLGSVTRYSLAISINVSLYTGTSSKIPVTLASYLSSLFRTNFGSASGTTSTPFCLYRRPNRIAIRLGGRGCREKQSQRGFRDALLATSIRMLPSPDRRILVILTFERNVAARLSEEKERIAVREVS